MFFVNDGYGLPFTAIGFFIDQLVDKPFVLPIFGDFGISGISRVYFRGRIVFLRIVSPF